MQNKTLIRVTEQGKNTLIEDCVFVIPQGSDHSCIETSAANTKVTESKIIEYSQSTATLDMTVAKLKALQHAILDFLKPDQQGRESKYFDPQKHLEYFQRFTQLLNDLKMLEPTLYCDLPVRSLPESSNTSDFGGRGYFTRSQIKALLTDIEYCLNIVPPIKNKDMKNDLNSELVPPSKVTLAWLVRHVSIPYWVMAVGLVLSIFVIGLKAGQVPWVVDFVNIIDPTVSKPSIDAVQPINTVKIDSVSKLTELQREFLENLVEYQQQNNLTKLIISREGDILDNSKGLKNVNVIEHFLKQDREIYTNKELEQLILTMPDTFMKIIPEARLGSPFVVTYLSPAKEI